MSTDDLLPPHELRGPLGQAGDAGGGIVPLLAPAPLPNALANASPGVSPGAAMPAPPITLPAADPIAMAALLQRMAGELFGGASAVPSPAPSLASASTLPSGPTMPSIPTLPSGPSIPPGPSVPGARSVPGAPSVPGALPMAPAPSPSAPSSAAALPSTASGPSLPTASSPFATPFSTINPTAFAGLTMPGAEVADFLRLPLFDDPAPGIDAPPYFLPAADAIGPGSSLPGPAIVTANELPTDGVPVRNLGGVAFDPHVVRRDFPILEERVHGKRLVWLDNAATTHKPRAVIDRLSHFYSHENSNIHRAAHTLAARATDAYEGARESVRRFLGARETSEIVFVRGATEGINLVAQSWGRRNVAAGDEIVISWLEHHANIVPWQQLCAERGARLRVAPVDDRGDIILEAYEKLLGPRTRLVAFSQVSNALGTVTPAREMVEIAHRYGARVLVDGAQAISHLRVDVALLDCDFYVFSGHKVFAPTGIGAVYGKRELLEAMPPWQGGGNMIQDVTFEKTTYQGPPFRFEAGTGNIADAVGLGAALDYVTRIGLENISRYEHDLLEYAIRELRTVSGLHLIGNPLEKAGVLSFVLDGQRTEDVGAALDKDGIAVRSGHHCAQPILRRFGLERTVRASLAFYNLCEDIDALVAALHRLQA